VRTNHWVSRCQHLICGHGVSSGAAGAAYLTTQWGDGTTVADQIAAATFNAPTGASLPITVFSGLTLPANVYYLMIFSDPDSEIAWDTTFDTAMANVALGAGVGLNPALLYDRRARRFRRLLRSIVPGNGWRWRPAVSPDNVTSAPEPAALYLSVIGVLGVAAWRLRSANSRKHLSI
jgi:hypothetical protein